MSSPEAFSAYTTSLFKGLYESTQSTAKKIVSIMTANPYHEDFKRVENLIIVKKDAEAIPVFKHPIVYLDKVFIDCRQLYNRNGEIKNMFEYSLLYRRAQLDMLWNTDKEIFVYMEPICVAAYANWFANGFQAKIGLNILQTTYCKILAATFALNLFNDLTDMNDNDIISFILKRLSKYLNIPVQVISDVITFNEQNIIELFKTKQLPLQVDCIEVLSKILNDAFDNQVTITPTVIRNSLCIGAINSRDVIVSDAVNIVAIGLEFMPTFILMLSIVNQQNLLQNTSVGRALQSVIRNYDKNTLDNFLRMNAPLTKV
jgi:hypothetical protein